jgi:hypothetical protein
MAKMPVRKVDFWTNREEEYIPQDFDISPPRAGPFTSGFVAGRVTAEKSFPLSATLRCQTKRIQ